MIKLVTVNGKFVDGRDTPADTEVKISPDARQKDNSFIARRRRALMAEMAG